MGKVTRFASFALAAGFALSIIAGTAGAAQAQGNSWFGRNGGNGNWAQKAAQWQARRANWTNNNGGLSGIANGFTGGGCHNGNSSWGNNGSWGNGVMGNAMGQWHKHHHHHHNFMNGQFGNGMTGYNGYGTGTGVAGFVPNPAYPGNTGAYGNPYGYGNGILPTGGTGSVIGNLLNGLTPNQAQQLGGGYGY